MKLILATFSMLVFNQFCYAQDKPCVFDPASATADFLKGKAEIKHFVWKDKTKEASAVLENGSLLYVKQWACTHRALYARLIDMYSEKNLTDEAYWFKRLLWLGELVLEKSDFDILKNALSKKTYQVTSSRDELSNRIVLSIPHRSFSEFRAEIIESNFMHVVNLAFDFN